MHDEESPRSAWGLRSALLPTRPLSFAHGASEPACTMRLLPTLRHLHAWRHEPLKRELAGTAKCEFAFDCGWVLMQVQGVPGPCSAQVQLCW